MHVMRYMLCALALISISSVGAQDKNQDKKNEDKNCASFSMTECAQCCKQKYSKDDPQLGAKIRECMERSCLSMYQPLIGETYTFE